MARKLRSQYPEAIYHVMNRGDRRERIYSDDQDRQRFLETLTETCQKTNWQIHAYCLMPNHFHLVVETPNPNLVAGMKWLLGTERGQLIILSYSLDSLRLVCFGCGAWLASSASNVPGRSIR